MNCRLCDHAVTLGIIDASDILEGNPCVDCSKAKEVSGRTVNSWADLRSSYAYRRREIANACCPKFCQGRCQSTLEWPQDLHKE